MRFNTLFTTAAAFAVVPVLSYTPSPPPYPPKSLSSRSQSKTSTQPQSSWSQSKSDGNRRKQQPLRASTVADNSKPLWKSLWNIPSGTFTEFAAQFGMEMEDSLLSFEGGNTATEAAKRPSMPNLEIENTVAAAPLDIDTTMEKDELVAEIGTLTKTFAELESSMDYKTQLYEEAIATYESTISNLLEKNTILEKSLTSLTAAMEKQQVTIQELQQNKEVPQVNVKGLEDDNEMLRQRVRTLELQLSEIAFESRQVQPVAIAAPAVPEVVKHTPKAPSVPVPPHISQQHQIEQLQSQVKELKQERSSVPKLFRFGIRRGVRKVGKVLNVCSPVYNLRLWGEMRSLRC